MAIPVPEKRILDFEEMGFGMFIHWGLYSQLGKGEWALKCLGIPQAEYDRLAETFCPDPQWAKSLASAAKQAVPQAPEAKIITSSCVWTVPDRISEFTWSPQGCGFPLTTAPIL